MIDTLKKIYEQKNISNKYLRKHIRSNNITLNTLKGCLDNIDYEIVLQPKKRYNSLYQVRKGDNFIIPSSDFIDTDIRKDCNYYSLNDICANIGIEPLFIYNKISDNNKRKSITDFEIEYYVTSDGLIDIIKILSGVLNEVT